MYLLFTTIFMIIGMATSCGTGVSTEPTSQSKRVGFADIDNARNLVACGRSIDKNKSIGKNKSSDKIKPKEIQLTVRICPSDVDAEKVDCGVCKEELLPYTLLSELIPHMKELDTGSYPKDENGLKVLESHLKLAKDPKRVELLESYIASLDPFVKLLDKLKSSELEQSYPPSSNEFKWIVWAALRYSDKQKNIVRNREAQKREQERQEKEEKERKKQEGIARIKERAARRQAAIDQCQADFDECIASNKDGTKDCLTPWEICRDNIEY